MLRRLIVAPWNSTVLGRIPNPKHDACKWFDGWKNLAFNSKRVHKDGCASKLIGKQKINFFGAGRNAGFSCGEYLHVPLKGAGADGRSYRVRCRFQPCSKYRGRLIHTVKVERQQGQWCWLIEAEQ